MSFLDPVNRMLLLLQKLQHEKTQRARVARSHGQLLGEHSAWVRYEHFLDGLLYSKALLQTFEGEPLQLSVCWDPGNYNGKQVNVSMVFYPSCNKAAYVLNQSMQKVQMQDLSDSLIEEARQGKLARVEGFSEFRTFCSALKHSLNIDMTVFEVPQGLVLRALKPGELRLQGATGKYFIVDRAKEVALPEIGIGINLSQLNIVVSISDQGPLNMSTLNYMVYGGQHMAFALWDPFHRTWNDIKSAMKRSIAGAWRCILELCILFNSNYGPFNTSQWYYQKRCLLDDFMKTVTLESPSWQKYEELICHERRQKVPSDKDDRLELLRNMGRLTNFTKKGPTAKLMRWFSLCECCLFWQHDFYATKMVLERQEGFQFEADGEDLQCANAQVQTTPGVDHKQELAELKRRTGAFKLCPTFINKKNMALKEIFMSTCKASWKAHAERARTIKSPDQVLAWNIKCASEGAWKDELVQICKCSVWEPDTLQHLTPQWSHHVSSLVWHADLYVLLGRQCPESDGERGQG